MNEAMETTSPVIEDDTMQIEIVLSDGTIARWGNVPAQHIDAIEALVGTPDTIKA